LSRGIIQLDGIDFDLSHLKPFTVQVTPKAEGSPTYAVLVSFGHHTFTRAFQAGVDNPAFKYEEHGDVRCFCPDRYLASKGLPNFVRQET
jgi:hypothetical protein